MIERLKTLEDDEIDMSVGATNTRFADTELVKKINELCDTVNELTSCVGQLGVEFTDPTPPENVQPDAESRPENVQDKFAEQRKWIGCVCRFWDNDDTQEFSYGVLTAIDTDFGVGYSCNGEYEYDNCEPVKPDDDIIYKGE